MYNQTGQYIGLLVINGGREFSIKELNDYAKLVGMNILRMAFYTFEQNKTLKRISGIILSMARLMTVEVNLLEYLWDEACKIAIWI